MRYGYIPLPAMVLALAGCTLLPPFRAEIAAKASDTQIQLTRIITTLQTRPEEKVPYSAVEQYVVAALADMNMIDMIDQTRAAEKGKQPAQKVSGWAKIAAEACIGAINSQRTAWYAGDKAHEIEGWENVRDLCLHTSEFEDIFKNPTGA